MTSHLKIKNESEYPNDVTYRIQYILLLHSQVRSNTDRVYSKMTTKTEKRTITFFISPRERCKFAKITLVPAIFSLVTRQHKSARP